ncbi:hypothetical protein ACFRQM_25965 [Streptomyces sp. NPDC056831]|uniref:hypothetical protein n=1 Tax=Streptomyces sp. NPDC056831 TaxID=3345954 RepID=UPI003673F92E
MTESEAPRRGGAPATYLEAPFSSGAPAPVPTPSYGETPARRATPNPLRAELRHGIAPWTGLAVALTVLIPLWSKAPQWQGSWGATQTQLHAASALLAGPLVAAAACWQGGREHRRRTAELLLSTPRSRLAQVMAATTPIALWAAAGYLVALAVAFAATAPYTGAGSPPISLAATDLGFLLSICFVGFVVGRLARWRLTAPVLAACAFVVLGFPDYVDSAARFLSPAQVVALDVSVPVRWFAPFLLAWTGGIAATVLLGYAARRRYLAVVPLALAVAAGTMIMRTGADLFHDNPAMARRVCSEVAPGTPQICVNAYDAPVLPQMSKALAGMFSRLEGVPGAPVTYVAPWYSPKNGEATLAYVTRGWGITRNRLTDPHQYRSETASALVNRDCSTDSRGKDRKETERVERTDDAVISWLSGKDSTWFPNSPQLVRLEAMPDADRKAWLGRFLATRKSCTPSEVPVL